MPPLLPPPGYSYIAAAALHGHHSVWYRPWQILRHTCLSCQWLSCWCLISVLATWPLAFLCCGHMEAGRLMHCMHIYSVVQSSVREHVFYVFQISKKLRFFSEMTCQKVTSRYRKFRAESFKMSSHTSLSDHRNSFQLFICQSSAFEEL